jgi:hypothetical protein
MSAAFGGRLSGRVNTVKLSLKLCKTQNEKPLIVTHWKPPLPLRNDRNTRQQVVPKRQFSFSPNADGGECRDFQIQLKFLLKQQAGDTPPSTLQPGAQSDKSRSAAARSFSIAAEISR